MHGEKKLLLCPRTPITSMQALPSPSCLHPSVLAKPISMHYDTHSFSNTATPETTITPSSPTHGSLLGLKLVHSYSNRPQSPSHAHSFE